MCQSLSKYFKSQKYQLCMHDLTVASLAQPNMAEQAYLASKVHDQREYQTTEII